MRPLTEIDPVLHVPLMRSRESRIPDAAFAVFILLVLVGLEPFKSRDFAGVLASGEGDLSRQIAFVGMFAILLLLFWVWRGLQQSIAAPVIMMPILGWLFLSAIWSLAPDITLRRAGLTAVIVWSAFLAVNLLGSERTLRVLYLTLACILIVNIASVAVIPNAVHLPGDFETSIVGGWRGMHFHKNIAGSITTISALIFLYFALERRKIIDWLLFATALVFLVGTGSKTAMSLLALCILLTAVGRWAAKTKSHQRGFSVFFVFGLIFSLSLLFVLGQNLLDYLIDPTLFTGRGAVWQLAVSYVSEHPLLGSGFGAFWQIGDLSPALRLGSGWAATAAHSHNGYLELLMTTGFIGLLLGAFSAVIMPFKRLFTFRSENFSLLFAWLTFCVLQNITETRIFQGAREEWVLHLIAIALIYVPFGHSDARSSVLLSRDSGLQSRGLDIANAKIGPSSNIRSFRVHRSR
jgi:exopolysaccharide production protein ExoQ